MTIPLIVADLGLSAQPEREAAGGVLPRLRHHLDPGGHAGADRRREGQIVSSCNLFGNGLMLAVAPLATNTTTASPVNAMAVAFFAAGTRPLGTCPDPTFASRVILILVVWRFRLEGASEESFVPGFFQGQLVPVHATSA